MSDILDEVLKAEEAADRVLSQARTEAAELKRAASEEASEAQERAREEARKLVETRVETARAEAQRRWERTVREAETAEHEFMLANRRGLERIADEIVAFVVTPEHRRGE